MLTRKVGLMASFAVWLLALGLLLANSVLVLAAVPVALYVALTVLDPRPHVDFEITRTLPPGQVYEKDQVVVTISVRNRGPRASLEIVDGLPPAVQVSKGSNHLFASLAEGESREFAYSLIPGLFGNYTFGPLQARATTRFATKSEERTFESYNTLRVYPEIKYLRRVDLRHSRPRNWPGETPTRHPGQGLEFYGIREYSPGDSVKRINWLASARTGQMMLNQYMNESGGETVVVLDYRSSSMVGTPPDMVGAHSVRGAAALCYRLLRDRNRVGLVGVGRRMVKVPPAFGRRQFEKILAALITMEPSRDDLSIDIVPYYLALFYSRMVQVVLVSPMSDREPFYLVSTLARRGYDLLVVSPSPVDLDDPPRGDERTVRLARELALMDRSHRLGALQKYARVVDWDPRLPLGDALEGLKEKWMVRRPT